MKYTIWSDAGLALILHEKCVYFDVGPGKMLALFAGE